MKYFRIIIIAILVLAGLEGHTQTYQTGTRSVTFNDPARSNRAIPIDLYYPATTSGAGVPLASGTDSFPVVVFGHGFTLPPSSYARLADSLARSGYIVALPNTETSFAPSHDNFGKDIAFLAAAVPAQNTISTSFLYQRVRNRSAVGGHSMGGGCSFLAAATGRPEIKALFNFAAAETNPSATTAASSVNVPALVFSGSSDCIVPPATQLSMYSNIPAGCKTYLNITGGTHCQIANNNSLCTFGQVTSGCNSSSINPDIFLNKSLSMLRPFLDYVLKENCYRGIDYIDNYLQITGVSDKLNTCPPPNCSVLPVTLLNFNGVYRGRSVELRWQTTGEENILNYVVQKSGDGLRFSDLQTVPGKGNGNNDYMLIDPSPYSQNSYYRLRVFKAGGISGYSDIISVRTSDKPFVLNSIFPNPSNGPVRLSVSSTSARQITYRLFDIRGAQVMTGKLSVQQGLNEYSLSPQGISGGVYLLRLYGESGEVLETVRLIRQ